jgi:hypothetical protein
MVFGLPAALLAIVSVPLRLFSAVGVKVTFAVHEAPAASGVAGQLCVTPK